MLAIEMVKATVSHSTCIECSRSQTRTRPSEHLRRSSLLDHSLSRRSWVLFSLLSHSQHLLRAVISVSTKQASFGWRGGALCHGIYKSSGESDCDTACHLSVKACKPPTTSLRSCRVHLCQSGEASQGARYAACLMITFWHTIQF